MKKKASVFTVFLFLCLLCLQFQTYADSASFDSLYSQTERPDFSRGAVSIYEVAKWNEAYQRKSESVESYEKYFSSRAVPMITTVDSEKMYFAVVDENGDYAYRIWSQIASMSNNVKGIYLQSCITGDYISLTEPTEQVLQFWSMESIFKEKIRKKQAYILENLDDTEYGGIEIDTFSGKANLKVYIYLVNEKRRAELEEEGFLCESIGYSLAGQYKVIEELWTRKNELGIIDIKIQSGAGLVIYGTEDKDIFCQKAGSLMNGIPYQYSKGVWSVFGSYGEEYGDTAQGLAKTAGLDLEKPEEFVRYLRAVDKKYTEPTDEKNWENLLQALLEWKQAYPKYSCRNIYYHIAGDYNAAAYINFEPELLDFVNTLPSYQADKNAAVEDIYGDPQRLELKRLLHQYKEMKPEMSYEELYKTYIKAVEEDVLRSKEEKLYWYLWRKYSKEMQDIWLDGNKELEITERKELFLHEFHSELNCYIRLEELYKLIDAYNENPKLEIEKARGILKKEVKKYKSIFPKEEDFVFVDIIGEDGYVDYICGPYSISSSSAVGNGCMLLHSYWTNEEIDMNKPKEEIEKFIGRTDKIAGQVKEKLFFVRNHLGDSEYSSVYRDFKGGVCVMLADETKASMLEKEGISWKKAATTREQIYEKVSYLWENRESLKIADVKIWYDDENISIYGYGDREEFCRKLEDNRFDKDYYIQIGNYQTLEEFLEGEMGGWITKEGLARLKECMEVLEAEYPEYGYRNLCSLVFQNPDNKNFSGFDNEIEAFADKLDFNICEKNPFDRKNYGDPENLLLKMILQRYKGLYPEKSCQELYDTYVREIVESEVFSYREKRMKCLCEIVKIKQLENGRQTGQQLKSKSGKEISVYPAAAGFVVLIICCGVVIFLKAKNK